MKDYHVGYKLFIYAIFERAILDIVAAPNASDDPRMKYRKSSPHYDSADAKRFLKKDNKSFISYCDLLELEPDYAEKKLLDTIQYIIENPGAFKGIIHAMS